MRQLRGGGNHVLLVTTTARLAFTVNVTGAWASLSALSECDESRGWLSTIKLGELKECVTSMTLVYNASYYYYRNSHLPIALF